jgi:hypothetical protein
MVETGSHEMPAGRCGCGPAAQGGFISPPVPKGGSWGGQSQWENPIPEARAAGLKMTVRCVGAGGLRLPPFAQGTREGWGTRLPAQPGKKHRRAQAKNRAAANGGWMSEKSLPGRSRESVSYLTSPFIEPAQIRQKGHFLGRSLLNRASALLMHASTRSV